MVFYRGLVYVQSLIEDKPRWGKISQKMFSYRNIHVFWEKSGYIGEKVEQGKTTRSPLTPFQEQLHRQHHRPLHKHNKTIRKYVLLRNS